MTTRPGLQKTASSSTNRKLWLGRWGLWPPAGIQRDRSWSNQGHLGRRRALGLETLARRLTKPLTDLLRLTDLVL